MKSVSRRELLKFVASSPLFSLLHIGNLRAEDDWEDRAAELISKLITTPDEAINVFDFRAAAQKTLPPAHYGYLATGADDGVTIRANRAAFERVYLRPHRLVDGTMFDPGLELLGQKMESPIMLAPAGSHKAFHAEGEIAVAKAARNQDTTMVLSTAATTSIEDVSEARGAPVWFQLYPTDNKSATRKMLVRAERSGSPVVMLTVDVNAGRNSELERRYAAVDARNCKACHSGEKHHTLKRKPMFNDAGLTLTDRIAAPAMNWDFVDWLKDNTSMKVVLKGIVRGDDAQRAVEHGVDGLVVSNHGGRASASGWGALESLPGVVAAVDGRIPIIMDSGIRRGADAYKALALGASAVMIGRPYLWGLSSFGQPGVEKVLALLQRELSIIMRQMGTPRLAQIGSDNIGLR